MASRLFYRGSVVGDAEISNMIENILDGSDDTMYNYLAASYSHYMDNALERLDNRLWWQPETSEVFWENDGSEKPLPDIDFEEWWNETSRTWFDSEPWRA